MKLEKTRIYRHKLGIYPKWVAKWATKGARFILRYLLPWFRLDVCLRGRGARASIAREQHLYHTRYRSDLPVAFASKVAVYITLWRRING